MSARGIIRQVFILAVLGLLILAPSWVVGWSEVQRARQLVAAGQVGAAATAYASAAQRLFWRPQLWEQAGQLALASGDPALACRYFASARERHALSTQGWIGWGDALYQLTDTEQARQAWQQALPEPEAHRRFARLAMQQRNFAEAITHWQSVLKQRPEDIEANYRLGLLLAATQPKQALSYLMQAAQLDSGLADAVHALRTSLNQAGREPASWFFQGGLGLASIQEWELAEEAFRQALARQPDQAEAWAWLAESLQQQGKDGQQELEQALRLHPDSATVLAIYGMYLQRQGKPDQAIATFQTVLRSQPTEAAWWAALASVYEQEGDLIRALAHYQKAAQLAPSETTYWRALIRFCLRHHVYVQEVALPATRTLFDLAPDAWYSQALFGQVLLEMGDIPGAQAALQQALTLAPNQAEVYLALTMLYLQKGDSLAACHALQRANILNPAALSWEMQRLREQLCPPH